MPDHRLDGLAAFEPAPLLVGERLVLAPVDDLDAGVVGIHTSEAQVHDGLIGAAPQVLQQVGRLLQLRAQDVPVVGGAGEASCSHHQALLVRDR